MKEILPGVYHMTLTLSGFDPGSTNSYLIKTDHGYTMIDTGWDSPESVQSMEEQMAEIGARLSDIQEIILTHGHIDHMGLVPRLKKLYHPKVYLHEKEIELMKIRFSNGDQFIPMTDIFLQTHGVPKSELTPPEFQLPQSQDFSGIQPDVLLQGGEEIAVGDYNFQVINTPGHTPGHVAYYEEQKKFLFSGDVLLPTIATNAAFHVQHIPYPLQQYLTSLMTLRKLDIDLVLPGHEYVFTGHRQRIDELFHDHEEKASEILQKFTDGEPRTAYLISRGLAMSSRTGKDHWPQMTGWVKRFAVLQVVAHLESLRFNHKLKLEIQNGIKYYRITRSIV